MSTSALPDGWKREEVKRTNGLTIKTDVIYVSPEGQRIKSKAELAKYLGQTIDLSSFDYRSGKINPLLLRKSKRSYGVHDHRALKHDPTTINPVRQTNPFFKHPVTIVRTNTSNSKVLNLQHIKEIRRKHNLSFNEPKSDNNNERPFQMFWPRRLEGQRASNHALERLDDFQLPPNIRTFNSTLANNEDIFRTITANLYNDQRAIRGQERKIINRICREMDEEDVMRNLLAFINPHQPLSHTITITDQDIIQQEEVVRKYRRKLRDAINR